MQQKKRPSPILSQITSSRQSVRSVSTLSTASRAEWTLYGALVFLGSGGLYLYVTDTRASVHRWLVVPVLRILVKDAEDAHRTGNGALRWLWQLGLHPRERQTVEEAKSLQIQVLGVRLESPVATSAGIDKDAEIPDALFALGPSIVEIGGVTPLPQDGNAKPRVFRVSSQKAMINRYGLNSRGADHMAVVLRSRVQAFAQRENLGSGLDAEKYVLDGEAGVPPGSLHAGKLLAINIAKNKATPDHDLDRVANDYVYCVEKLGKYADILVVNVSSPNTPGLRAFQQSEPLSKILNRVVEASHKVDRRKRPMIMVKVSPDEDSDAQVSGVTEAVYRSGVDGIIVGNTTNTRPTSSSAPGLSRREEQTLTEQGGYSGPQLFSKTLELVRKYRKSVDSHTSSTENLSQSKDPKGSTPKAIFATGGVTNGKQLLELLDAGANVAMVYTALVYGGSGTITRIKREMREERRRVKQD